MLLFSTVVCRMLFYGCKRYAHRIHYHFRYSSNSRPLHRFNHIRTFLGKTFQKKIINCEQFIQNTQREKSKRQSMKPQIAIWSHGLFTSPQIRASLCTCYVHEAIQSLLDCLFFYPICNARNLKMKIWKIIGKCWVWSIKKKKKQTTIYLTQFI